MAILSFFRTAKHRRFDYKPLYYDERKEKLKEILNSSDSSVNTDSTYKSELKGAIRRTADKRKNLARASKVSRSRLLIIILLLAAAAYYFIIK